MGTTTNADRRRTKRVKSRVPVRLVANGEEFGVTMTRDLGVDGLGIEIGPSPWATPTLVVGRHGHFLVELSAAWGHTIRAPTEVVWWHLDVSENTWRYRAGLRFLGIQAIDRMRLRRMMMLGPDSKSDRPGPTTAKLGPARRGRGL